MQLLLSPVMPRGCLEVDNQTHEKDMQDAEKQWEIAYQPSGTVNDCIITLNEILLSEDFLRNWHSQSSYL